ncbi:hypothetical protein HDU76_000029 [Blyttiomyces sp. JEL0837]|nr:hypothetical protein HDU76_000029 [Blyttiomyces sp. JEL0837]
MVVEWLINHGANPWNSHVRGEWPIARQLKEGDEETPLLSLRKFTIMEGICRQIGHDYLKGKIDETVLKGLGLKGSQSLRQGWTLLHAAYYNLNFEIITRLLPIMDYEDLVGQDIDGNSPLSLGVLRLKETNQADTAGILITSLENDFKIAMDTALLRQKVGFTSLPVNSVVECGSYKF